jgi:hypothetical protein
MIILDRFKMFGLLMIEAGADAARSAAEQGPAWKLCGSAALVNIILPYATTNR